MHIRILSGVVLLLVSGCGFAHRLPLHSDYQAIRLNRPCPAKYDQSDSTAESRILDWGNSTGATESIGVIVDGDRIVRSKKYQVEGEAGSLLFLMYKRLKKTEWEIAINESTQKKIFQALRNGSKRLQFVGNDHDLEALLQYVEAHGDITNRSFRLQQARYTEFFPMACSEHWQLEWSEANTIKIVIEASKDISLVVWAMHGWGSWFITGSSH